MKEEIRKRRRVDDHPIPLKENILEEQEQLHDVKVECFAEIQKMAYNQSFGRTSWECISDKSKDGIIAGQDRGAW